MDTTLSSSMSFEELGLDHRLLRALSKKSIEKTFPIQRLTIPPILEGRDVVVQAHTGSGKTLAYLLPLLHKLFTDDLEHKSFAAPSAIILVPTRELTQQVYSVITSLIDLCNVKLKAVQLTTSTMIDSKTALSRQPEVVVSTPACLKKCISSGMLTPDALQKSLSTLVLDEADLLLSYGYEDDLKAITSATNVPKHCQRLLMSATSSADVEKLKILVLRNPCILSLPEVAEIKDEIVPGSIMQSYIECSALDKFLYTYVLLKFLFHTKVLIFTNSVDMSFRLKLFLNKFHINPAVLNAELPQNSRQYILEAFNAGKFDYLIVSDVSKSAEEKNDKENRGLKRCSRHPRKNLDAEFGVVRGIDFKGVNMVLNFEMPQTAEGYVHRIGRTGRAYNTGEAVSLVSPEESEIFEEIKSLIGENDTEKFIDPFPSVVKNVAEMWRYRAEDACRSVTKVAVRVARAEELRNQILNSEKLKAHFEENPKDLDLLKQDKASRWNALSSHLHSIPDYLVDPVTQEAIKILKLARAAMSSSPGQPKRRKRIERKFKKSQDPLKAPNGGLRNVAKKRKGDDI